MGIMFARGSNITTGLMILAFELFSKVCLNRFRMNSSSACSGRIAMESTGGPKGMQWDVRESLGLRGNLIRLIRLLRNYSFLIRPGDERHDTYCGSFAAAPTPIDYGTSGIVADHCY
jgi:hypothetical protein